MKKNNKLLITIGVLLVVGIGISFAYFLVGVNITGDGSNTNATTYDFMKVSYDAGSSTLNASNLTPGHSASKSFKVTLTPTELEKSAIYAIMLNIRENTFVKCSDSNYNEISNACRKEAEEIIYKLKDNNGTILATGDLTDGVTGEITLLKEDKTVESRTEYNYTLEIEFKETNADQNHNANKIINGEIKVEFTSPDAQKVILANNTIDESRISGEFTSVFTEDTAGRIFKGPEDDYGETTYFFAGANPNNWVQFGGFYWRIIRINGDGTIRMIYSGTANGDVSDANKTGATTQINGSIYKFSHKDASGHPDYNYANDNAYVGYMYGQVGSSSYADTHKNTISSYAKQQADTWYNTNLNKTGIKEHIDMNAGFCGDRKIGTTTMSGYNNYGYGTNKTVYGAFNRMLTQSGGWNNTHTPTFKCSQNNDLYTVSGTSKGNKTLTNPVGLITVDEVVYAGGHGNTNNTSYYLYTNQNFWTMSPYGMDSSGYTRMFYVGLNGYLSIHFVGNELGIRPVINLRADTTLTGDGTETNPYKVV